MQKKFFITYFFIIVTFLSLMSLSRHTSDKMRGHSVALLAPLWEKILAIKYFIFNPSKPDPFTHVTEMEDRQKLLLDNKMLEIENAYLQGLMNEQRPISNQIAHIAHVLPEQAALLGTQEYQHYLEHSLNLLKERMQAIPGRVIFRSFDSWNSFLWINVGNASNQMVNQVIIANNSPVVVGKAIVGIIDYVGEHQSRVRLITDHRLVPSVRAARGGEQESMLSELIENLLLQISERKHGDLSSEEQNRLIHLLRKFKRNLQPHQKTWHLAKGKLLGSIYPAKLGQKVYLKGMGFNYDFPDVTGPSRNLRNVDESNEERETLPILKVNDLLVTTGMDGIFPPGFHVAVVTEVNLLKEGAYYYDLVAKPVVNPVEQISLVFVLPPMAKENFHD